LNEKACVVELWEERLHVPEKSLELRRGLNYEKSNNKIWECVRGYLYLLSVVPYTYILYYVSPYTSLMSFEKLFVSKYLSE
jgi:hypothetical protein